MVSIKSIVLIALASFAVASPMFGGDEPKDVQGKEFDGKESGEGGEFKDNWLSDLKLLNNKKEGNSWEDNKSIQNQQCGNEQSVVACCNKGAADSKGFILGALVGDIGGPCSKLAVDTNVFAFLNGLHPGSGDKQCSGQKQIACCAPHDNVKQDGPININAGHAISADCLMLGSITG